MKGVVILSFILLNVFHLQAQCDAKLKLVIVEKVCPKVRTCEFDSLNKQFNEIYSHLDSGKYLIIFLSKKILSGGSDNRYLSFSKERGCEIATNFDEAEQIKNSYFTGEIKPMETPYYNVPDANIGLVYVLRSYENEYKNATIAKFFRTDVKCPNTNLEIISLISEDINPEEQFKQCYQIADFIGLGGLLEAKKANFKIYSTGSAKDANNFKFNYYPTDKISFVTF